MDHFHLAQINIAQAKDPMDSATMEGFVDRLDGINALADQSPGFVWRLQTEEGKEKLKHSQRNGISKRSYF